MANTIEWMVEKRVILVTLTGGYDENELKNGVEQVVALLNEGEAPTHLIIDASQVTGFPANFAEPISQIRRRQVENNAGWTVLIANNPMMRFFGTIAAKVMNERFRPVPTLDAAKTFLHYIDARLFHEDTPLKTPTSE